MAAPAFRAASSAQNTSNSATIAVTVPSSVVAGDMLVAFVGDRNNQSTTAPSGWTQVKTQAFGSSYTGGLAVFSKTAVAGDASTSVTFNTNAVGSRLSAAIAAYSGATKVDVSASNAPPIGSTATAPLVTASHGNELIVEVWQAQEPASVTLSPPATSRLAQNNTGNGNNVVMLAVADQTQSSSGQSKAATCAGGSTQTYWVAATLALSSNAPPNAPTLNFPTNANQPIDRTSTNRFTWTFSDPDAGDSQSAFDLQYTTQGGSYPSTPQYSGTTPNNYLDIPDGTFAAGSYQWQVRTYDSQGVVGPWSSAAFFAAQTPPAGPTITYPTSGGTVNSPDHIDWSYTSQQSYQVQRVADNAGAIDTTTVYYDTGEVQDPNNTIRTQALTFPTNNRYEWLRLRIKQNNQWSAWVSERVLVSYTPPPTPGFTATAGTPNPSAMTITVATPAPSSNQPPATSILVEASRDGGATSEWSAGALTPVLPNSTVVYQTPALNAAYSIRVTARADNGTTSSTGWVS